MGILAKMVEEKRATVYNPLHPKDPGLVRLFGDQGKTATGVSVDENTALSSTAMFAGVRFLAENLASVPLKIYRRAGRGKDPLRDDRRWGLLQHSANPEQTALEFREMCMGFVATTGNAFAEIVEGEDGIAEAFWPIVPWRVRLIRSSAGALSYMVKRPGGGEVAIPPERMLHFRGFSRSGLLGDDVIERMKEAIGLTIAAERSAGAFFGNGAQPSGVLHTDQALSEPAWERLKSERDKMHGGFANFHRLAILEEGLKWHQMSTDPEKSQLIETRKFQVTEVARILNLPPHVLKDLERSTFSNIEHQGLELVTYSLRPWAVRLEQVYEMRLLLPRERATHLIRHNLGGFLRGDLKAQTEYFTAARQWGWYSANDVREDLDLNGIGDQGDVYMAPLNMLPADQFTTAGLAAPPEENNRRGIRESRNARSALIRKRTEASFRPVFEQRFSELVRREANAVRKAVARAAGVADFLDWSEGFYDNNAGVLARATLPMFAGLADAIFRQATEEVGGDAEPDIDSFLTSYAETYGLQESGSSQRQLAKLANENPEDYQEVIEERVGEWEENRARKQSLRESVDLGSAVALLAFGQNGVTRKVWHTIGETCPLCRMMHGRTVELSVPFILKGDSVAPEDVTPLIVERHIRHPQLHGGCDCTVVAG